jgi:hypothetical protein
MFIHPTFHNLAMIMFILQVPNNLLPGCIILMSLCLPSISYITQIANILLSNTIMFIHPMFHNLAMIMFLLQVPNNLLPGCIILMSLCLPSISYITPIANILLSDTIMFIHPTSHNLMFLLQVPNVLLPGCLQLLAAALSRHTQPRLANGLRASPHGSHRLTQPRYLPLLRLLLPCSLQGHRRLRGKFSTSPIV